MADSNQLIPSITGNSTIDGILRILLGSMAAAITTWLVVTLKITDPNLVVEVGTMVLSFVGLMAVVVWSYIHSANTQKAVVQHTVDAAITGKLPAPVMAVASLAQLRAVKNSQTAAQMGAKNPEIIR